MINHNQNHNDDASLTTPFKALVKALQLEAATKDSKLFQQREIAEICRRLQLERAPEDLIDSLHTECYLLAKGSKMFELAV